MIGLESSRQTNKIQSLLQTTTFTPVCLSDLFGLGLPQEALSVLCND